MLRFFRNIRQKLIEQENMRKYFWYALGEILLVMIGILLALQVNNWKLDRLASAQYHERLALDLERLINATNNLNQMSDRTLRQLVETQPFFENGEIPEGKEDMVQEAFDWFFRFNYQNPELTTLQEMKSNGDLDLI